MIRSAYGRIPGEYESASSTEALNELPEAEHAQEERENAVASLLKTAKADDTRQQTLTALFNDGQGVLNRAAESPTVSAGLKLAIYLGIGKLINTQNAVLAQSLTIIADPVAKMLWEKLKGFPPEPNIIAWRDIYREVMCSDHAKQRIISFPQQHQMALEKISNLFYRHVSNENIYIDWTQITLILRRWLFFMRPENQGKTDWDKPVSGENISRNEAMEEFLENAGEARGVFQTLWLDIQMREEKDVHPSFKEKRTVQPLLIGPPGVGKTTLFKQFAKISDYTLVVFDSSSKTDLDKVKLFGPWHDCSLTDMNKNENDAFGDIPAAYMRNSPKVLALFDNMDLTAFSIKTDPQHPWEPSLGQILQTLFDRKSCHHLIHSLNEMHIDLSTWILAATSNFKFADTSDLDAISDRFLTCYIHALVPAEKRRRVRLYLKQLPEKFKLTPLQETQADKLLDFIIENDSHNPSSRQAENAFELTIAKLRTNQNLRNSLSSENLESEIKKEVLGILKPQRAKPEQVPAMRFPNSQLQFGNTVQNTHHYSQKSPAIARHQNQLLDSQTTLINGADVQSQFSQEEIGVFRSNSQRAQPVLQNRRVLQTKGSRPTVSKARAAKKEIEAKTMAAAAARLAIQNSKKHAINPDKP